jgi:plastocyanin
MTPRRSGLALALVVLALALVACTTSESPTATPVRTPAVTSGPDPTPSATPSAEPELSATQEAEDDEERVTIGTSDFEPATLTISAGTVVVFENEATFDHTVTEGTGGQAVEDPLVDESVAPGADVRVTFDEAGTFDITCLIHPTMQMTITVED